MGGNRVSDGNARDRLIDELATGIQRRKLIGPAILFLEANKPFSFIGSQLLLMAEPLLGIFVPDEKVRDLALLLEDRANVERLLQRLEAEG